MAGKFLIEDAFGSGVKAKVTSRGQLVTAPLEYSSISTLTMDVINTAYNFYSPIQGKQFVITGILTYADKNVGTGDASVEIYEAEGATETTVSSSILNFELPKNAFRDLTALNLITSPGVWINGKTNDNNVFTTILGYYVSTEENS